MARADADRRCQGDLQVEGSTAECVNALARGGPNPVGGQRHAEGAERGVADSHYPQSDALDKPNELGAGGVGRIG